MIRLTLSRPRMVGVSIAVEQRGRPILAKGNGYEDLEQDVPATVRIGQLTARRVPGLPADSAAVRP